MNKKDAIEIRDAFRDFCTRKDWTNPQAIMLTLRLSRLIDVRGFGSRRWMRSRTFVTCATSSTRGWAPMAIQSVRSSSACPSLKGAKVFVPTTISCWTDRPASTQGNTLR